jgi:hypothetical protein
LAKQEARSWHRPAIQFPLNIEFHFAKVRTAKKKKDKTGRKLGRGGNVAEGMHRTADLTMTDNTNFVLWEFSVSTHLTCSRTTLMHHGSGRTSTHHVELWHGQRPRQLLSQKDGERRAHPKGEDDSSKAVLCF